MSISSVNGSKILDVDRFMNMPSRRTKEDISLCSWLLALENSLIGLGGRGRGRKEGQGSAGDTLGWWRSGLPCPLPTPPAWTQFAGPWADRSPGAKLGCHPSHPPPLLPNYNPSFPHDQNSKCHERNLKASEQTGGELLKSFRGHLCWVYWENPLWPWLWPVKALCAHFHHLMTAQIMPTTAGGVRARKIMNNKCSSEWHQSFQSVFTSSPRREEVQPGGIPDHFHSGKTSPSQPFTTKPFSN